MPRRRSTSAPRARARHHPPRRSRTAAVARRSPRCPRGSARVRAARHRVLHPSPYGPGFSVSSGAINRTLQEMAPAYVIGSLHAPRGGEGRGGLEGHADTVGRSVDDFASTTATRTLERCTALRRRSRDRRRAASAVVDEIYNAAMAHVGCGYTQHRPSLLMDADEMFAQFEDAARVAAKRSAHHASSGGRHRAKGRVSQLRAAAAGGAGDGGARRVPDFDGPHRGRRAHPRLDPGTATTWMGSAGGASVGPTTRRAGMTEGLCAMADRWSADVASSSFRDGARINRPRRCTSGSRHPRFRGSAPDTHRPGLIKFTGAKKPRPRPGQVARGRRRPSAGRPSPASRRDRHSSPTPTRCSP